MPPVTHLSASRCRHSVRSLGSTRICPSPNWPPSSSPKSTRSGTLLFSFSSGSRPEARPRRCEQPATSTSSTPGTSTTGILSTARPPRSWADRSSPDRGNRCRRSPAPPGCGIAASRHFIRHNDYADTLAISQLLLHDSADLIHKATGWTLREVGKKDPPVLRAFLDRHAPTMPRTMLRSCIERFSPAERQEYLARKC